MWQTLVRPVGVSDAEHRGLLAAVEFARARLAEYLANTDFRLTQLEVEVRRAAGREDDETGGVAP
jgi:hypothetical protein